VRLNYNPSPQTFTAFYDSDGSGNGCEWQVYGSFGVGPQVLESHETAHDN
jgi:hypothetical protein